MITIIERVLIEAPAERCFDLARSIDLHVASAGPSREEAIGGRTSGLLGPEEWVEWRATNFGVRQCLSSRITAYDPPHHFRDEMVRGAFHSFRHDHFFSSVGQGKTEMQDRLTFAAPLSFLGWCAERLFLARYMSRFLRERNTVLRRVAQSDEWHRYLPVSDTDA